MLLRRIWRIGRRRQGPLVVREREPPSSSWKLRDDRPRPPGRRGRRAAAPGPGRRRPTAGSGRATSAGAALTSALDAGVDSSQMPPTPTTSAIAASRSLATTWSPAPLPQGARARGVAERVVDRGERAFGAALRVDAGRDARAPARPSADQPADGQDEAATVRRLLHVASRSRPPPPAPSCLREIVAGRATVR